MGADDSLVLAESLDVLRVPVPQWLAGRTLAATDLRSVTGRNVVGLVGNGTERVGAGPGYPRAGAGGGVAGPRR